MMRHIYTEEEKEFIAGNAKGRSTKELTDMVNKKFGLSLRTSQIRAFKKNYSITSGVDCRFKKDQEPWNKGKTGLDLGGKETQFKKGNKPHNYMPVGSERINGDGYVDIKIADPDEWKGKHILIWEKHNGPVPEGHVIIFGDRDNRNFEIENLICVSRQELLVMNQNGLIKNNSELTKTGVIIADLHRKIAKRKRQK